MMLLGYICSVLTILFGLYLTFNAFIIINHNAKVIRKEKKGPTKMLYSGIPLIIGSIVFLITTWSVGRLEELPPYAKILKNILGNSALGIVIVTSILMFWGNLTDKGDAKRITFVDTGMVLGGLMFYCGVAVEYVLAYHNI